MKIKKSITFEGEFIHGEINDDIAHLEIRSDDYTGKQIQELIVELQKVLQELPKVELQRSNTVTTNGGILGTPIGETWSVREKNENIKFL